MSGMDKPGAPPLPVLSAALIWGAVWGFAEATLGYLLHIVRVPGLPGLVMAPLAVWAMGRAYHRTGKLAAIPLAALAAAFLKLGALAVPRIDVLAVINPVRAILFESLAVLVFAAIFVRTPDSPLHPAAAARKGSQ
jgi:hypothetical protein